MKDLKHEGYSLEVKNHLGFWVEMGRCLSEERLTDLIKLFATNLKREYRVRVHFSQPIKWPEGEEDANI